MFHEAVHSCLIFLLKNRDVHNHSAACLKESLYSGLRCPIFVWPMDLNLILCNNLWIDLLIQRKISFFSQHLHAMMQTCTEPYSVGHRESITSVPFFYSFTGTQHHCNLKYMFQKDSERREKSLLTQILWGLRNLNSSIFAHITFLTLQVLKFLLKHKNY